MRYFIGIDLGGTNVRTLLVDEEGKSYSEVKDSTEREKGPDYVCSKIIRQIESIDYSVCGGIDNVSGIGIGVPGPVDTANGVMIMATNLPGFEEYPICEKLSTRFNLPVFLDNDANVAGLAEAILGAGKGKPTCYYVTISTGIGGALVVGAILGFIFLIPLKYFKKDSNRMALIVGFIFFGLGLSELCGFSSLLFCMAMGAVIANMSNDVGHIMKLCDKITPPIFMLFFVVNIYDMLVLDWGVFCHSKKLRIPGTEDMDEEYKDYLFHARGAAIGTGIGIIVAVLSGVMILVVNGGVSK